MDEGAHEALAREAADFLGLDIPSELKAGVAANLALLQQHAARVMAFPLDPEEESAGVFRP